MCRIFGFAGNNINTDVRRIIIGLILAEESNNPHGTGLALTNGNIFYHKKKGIRGLHFVARGYANFLWDPLSFKYLIGHVRLKTSGPQTDRNAHPFGSQANGEWYFLVHNGVLGNRMKELAKEKFKANVNDVEVDSEMFLRCITAQIRQGVNVVDAIKNATYEVSDVGDFAFALLTKKEIYLWRNSQRPLSVFYLGDNIFFASTLSMFQKAVEIAGIKLQKITYTELKPYYLYRLKVKNGKAEISVIDTMPHKERKLEKKKAKRVVIPDYLFAAEPDDGPEPPNPFLNGYGLEDELGIEVENVENMTTDELVQEIAWLEDYLYTGYPDARERKKIKERLNELYHEYNLRQSLAKGGNHEPF